jgi:hypothetical protein
MRRSFILTIILLVISQGSQTSANLFYTGINYDTGDEPVSICSSDYNEDGYPDLAVAGSFSERITIFLGLDGGQFSADGIFPVGEDARFIIDGDFNEDGHIDLAVACYTDSIWILLGSGDGTFISAETYHIEHHPLALAAGDFDSDGHTDLVVAREFTGSLFLLRGLGDGTFIAGPEIGIPHSIGSNSIIIGNFDSDSDIDIAVGHQTYYYDPFPINHGEVTVLLGRGDGFFDTRPMNELGEDAVPWSIVSADLNRDTIEDIVAVSWGRNEVAVLIGLGDGYFSPAMKRTSEPKYPRALIAEDFDGDELIDLMIAGYRYDSFNISMYPGEGDGTFENCRFYGAGDLPCSMIAKDLDGDGILDIAVTNSGSGNITILAGSPEGGLIHPFLLDGGEDPYDVESDDFNGDGIIDLAIAHSTYSGYVSIWLGEGEGSFSTGGSIAAGSRSSSVITEDFDNDGNIDLAVTNWNSDDIHVYLGAGDGSFSLLTSMVAAATPYSILSSDFNEDGLADLATANSVSNAISVYLGIGDGMFSSAELYPAGDQTVCIVESDFNEDGHIDIVAVNRTSNNITLMLGGGDGTFISAAHIPVGIQPWSAAVGDFDENGHEDIAVTNSSSNDVSVLLGAGDGTFSATVQYSIGKNPLGIAIDDFNNDGHVDLAVANNNSADFALLNGNGDGTFSQEHVDGAYSSSGSPHALHACDLDSDGDIDLVSANRGLFDDGLAVMIFNRTADEVSTMLAGYICAVETHAVRITWELSKTSSFMVFKAYRAEQYDGDYTFLNCEIINLNESSYEIVDSTCEPGIQYRYRVDVTDDEDSMILFETKGVAISPTAYSLFQNFPNPFNPNTTIRYSLPRKSHVTLSIYDITGRRIIRLIDSEKEAGLHSIEWTGLDEEGNQVESGVYFYRLIAGKQKISRKMILLR